jgi:hypothetical protein
MMVAAASPLVPLPAHTASAGRIRSYFLFTFCACLYILPFMQLFMLGTDEGTLDYGAVRIIHGQVFARDFFEVIGPGTFYWLAAFFKVFGVSFLATRICLFFTSLGTALLMYLLARRVCKRYQALPSVLLAGGYFGGIWPAISHHVDSNFFALLAVACLVLWQDRRSSSLLFAAGLFAAVTTCVLQPKGVLLFLAFLVWLWALHRRRTAPLSALGVIAGGYFGLLAFVLLYFWSNGALSSLINANFVWPYHHYEGVNSVPYANGIFSNYWDHWVIPGRGFLWTYPMAAGLLIPVLFIAALPWFLPALGARYRWNIAKSEILLYWLSGGALWVAELHRKDMTHLVFGSPLLIILCVHFLAEYPGRAPSLALQTLCISGVCLAGFNLVCLLLAAHPVKTSVGTVKTFKAIPALSFLEKHVAPDEEIFAYPYCPRYYFLSSTTNPTPFSILIYNYNTASQFQETVRVLDQHKVKYVLWDQNIEQVRATVFPASTRLPPGGLILEPYLESHYKLVQVIDGVRVLERKSDDGANQRGR